MDLYNLAGLIEMDESYTISNAPKNWLMIGACTYPAEVSVDAGDIRVVFDYVYKYILIEGDKTNNIGPLIPVMAPGLIFQNR